MPSLSKITVAEAVARALTDASIEFAVVHGLESYPVSLGRDVDILIHDKWIPKAIEVTRAALEENGCQLFAYRRMSGDFWCFVAIPETASIFEFDLISMLRWGPCALHSASSADGMRGPFPVDSLARFTKSIFLPLLGGDPIKATTRMNEFSESEDDQQRVMDFLTEKLGDKLAIPLWKALRERNLEKLALLVPRLKFRLIQHGVTAGPLPFLAATRHWIMNEVGLSPVAAPIAPSIAFVGPDGVGKSTVIDLVVKNIKNHVPFNAVHLRHWRPQAIPPLAKLFGKPVPRAGMANPPRRKAGRFSLIRLMYYAFDFIVGGWLKDRPRLAFNELVIYDRCVLDMMADPLRFGLSGDDGVSRVYDFSRKHDLVVLLKDTPERIFARKPELSLEEIRSQFAIWERLYGEGKIHAIIDVTNGPDKAFESVIVLIHAAAIKRLRLATRYS